MGICFFAGYSYWKEKKESLASDAIYQAFSKYQGALETPKNSSAVESNLKNLKDQMMNFPKSKASYELRYFLSQNDLKDSKPDEAIEWLKQNIRYKNKKSC